MKESGYKGCDGLPLFLNLIFGAQGVDVGRHRKSLEGPSSAETCISFGVCRDSQEARFGPCAGREAAGEEPSPDQGAAASVGPFGGAKQWNNKTALKFRLSGAGMVLPLPSGREHQRKKSCRFSGRTSFVPDGKIRLQGALFPSPMGRPLP